MADRKMALARPPRAAEPRVLEQTEPGYGGALLAGFAAARAPYVLTMDADLSHRPSFVSEMWQARLKAHVLIASRYVPGGKAEMSAFRRLLSKILNVTYARVLSLPYKDLSSGFRMYQLDAVKSLQLQARDFDVLEEILLAGLCRGLEYRGVAVPLHEPRCRAVAGEAFEVRRRLPEDPGPDVAAA